MAKREASSEAKSDAKLLETARARFKRVEEHEAEQRRLEIEDRKFHAADSDNGYMWPERVKNSRETDPNGPRPCLTINKIRPHTAQVANQQRQNRPSLKAIPVDDKADPKTAELLTGVFRHIHYNSDAEIAYDTACDQQVISGVGYWRVVHDYQDENTDEQDIYIRRIRNRFSVYMDPDIQDPTGADARFCFVIEDLPEEEFDAEHPDASKINWNADAQIEGGWFDKETKKVRRAEYFYVERQGRKRTIHWCLMSGKEVLKRQVWIGRYIPIVRVVGDELDIDGSDVVVKGMVRNAKDANRLYNYERSMYTEMNALAPRQPYIGAIGQFEGVEDRWKRANQVNYAYLEYNPVVDEAKGLVLPPPQRQPPAFPQAAYVQNAMMANDDIKAVMGQYDPTMGEESEAKSGRAINALKVQGETSNFHYIDNLARSIRQTGRIILDLLPKIYDTQRIARIIGEDLTPGMAMVMPGVGGYMDSQQAKASGIELARGVQALFDPAVGRYDVVVAVGPSYATKRQEAVETMTALSQANPQLMQIAGDLILRNMDVPGADDIAERLKATIPPEIRGKEEDEEEPIPPKALQMMQQMKLQLGQTAGQLQATQEALQEKDQELAKAQQTQTRTQEKEMADMQQAENDRRKLEIDAYNAETNRMKMLSERESAGLGGVGVGDGNALLQSIAEAIVQVAQGQEQLQLGLEEVARIAAAPRESELITDEQGRPIKAVSQVVMPERTVQ
jgi:hypothetical protein